MASAIAAVSGRAFPVAGLSGWKPGPATSAMARVMRTTTKLLRAQIAMSAHELSFHDTRIIECAECGGDGGFSEPWSMDPFTGAIKERVIECRACGGTGEEIIELQPVEMEDLEFMS